MSEPTRISSPPTSAPSARVGRPHWPWATYTHQPSQSSIHFAMTGNASQTSMDPRSSLASTGSPGTNAAVTSWSSGRHNGSSTLSFTPNVTNQETTRHWSFTAFEWVVHDVRKLKVYVEEHGASDGETSAPAEQNIDFEILKESPMMGDGKFKLEIARTPASEGSSSVQEEPQIKTLSLYITSLMLDFPYAEYETSASIMTAIKSQDDRLGERGARAEWVWEFWQDQWRFRHGSEVWECPLPLLSTLLANPRIQETDTFVICIQIHCPTGPFFPQQPSAYYVPRNLLDGLEASLDNANTGDVRFVCLERLQPSENVALTHSDVSTSFSSQTTARKRVIYAHSDIISRRSEYFATMLTSSFSENASGLVPGERKIYTITVEEADFETIYWLLKWVYGNWLLFKEHDDPRVAVVGVGEGWNARWLSARGGEWDWKTFRKTSASDGSNAGTRDDSRSVASVESKHSDEADSVANVNSKQSSQSSMVPTSSSVRVSKPLPPSKTATTSTSSARQVNNAGARRSTATTIPSASTLSSRSPSQPVPDALSTANFPASSHYPIPPRNQRQHPSSVASTIDPHSHPTPPPNPASALAMYQVAHRYVMPGLASLALEHLMSTITPQSSFPLLLATPLWEELRLLVEDYVVEKWDEVSVSDEFEQCCQEVAAGEWGVEGGKTLMALFRRLQAPTAAYVRT